jgi:hypothetical protein
VSRDKPSGTIWNANQKSKSGDESHALHIEKPAAMDLECGDSSPL